MKVRKAILPALMVLMVAFSIKAQDNIINYEFKKGEVLDILLLNKKLETDSITKLYFKTCYPIASKHGYNPGKGFLIKETPLQGNYHPEFMIIASWPSETLRKKCLVSLGEEVPHFHRMRREIWSTFNVAYYPLENDLAFQIDKEKYNVVTAYWEKSDEDMSRFIDKWKQGVQNKNGNVVLELTNAKSVFGYVYTPKHLLLTSWTSKEEFEEFKKNNLEMDHSTVEQVHQFKLQ